MSYESYQAEKRTWWQRRGLWLAIGALSILSGGAVKDRSPLPHDVSTTEWSVGDTVQWAGQVTLFGNVLYAGLGGLVLLDDRHQKREQQKINQLKARLPELQGNPTLFDVQHQLLVLQPNHKSEFRNAQARRTDLRPLFTPPFSGKNRLDEALDEVADNLASKLVTAEDHANTREARDMRYADVVRTCWLLDQAVPLSMECQATPWTDGAEEAGHKFWYEFILHRSELMANSVG